MSGGFSFSFAFPALDLGIGQFTVFTIAGSSLDELY